MSTLPAPIRAALAPFAPALFGASFDAPDEEWPDIDIFEALAWRDPAPAPAPVVAPAAAAAADDDFDEWVPAADEWERFHSQGCEFDGRVPAPAIAPAPASAIAEPTVGVFSALLFARALQIAVNAAPVDLSTDDFMVLVKARGLSLSLVEGQSI